MSLQGQAYSRKAAQSDFCLHFRGKLSGIGSLTVRAAAPAKERLKGARRRADDWWATGG
jgi:hypothetical protein